MSRRKLILERVIDGECSITPSDCVPRELLAKILTAQRFVFDSADASLLWDAVKDNDEVKDQAVNFAPYDYMWMELVDSRRINLNAASTAEVKQKLLTLAGADYCGGLPDKVENERNPDFAAYFRKDPFTLHLFMQTGGRGVLKGLARLSADGLELFEHLNFPKSVTQYIVSGLLIQTLAALYMFQVKGDIVRTVYSADAKLNAARKKRGKARLQDYTYIGLNRTVQQHGGTAEGSHAAKAAHLVRGHFKHCRTGTFWWRPHIAGKGEAKDRRAYIVKGESKCQNQVPKN